MRKNNEGDVKKMDYIGIYITHRERAKSKIEKEMKYIAERNAELERVLREAKEAEKELEKNRKRFMELAITYTDMRGDRQC